MSSNNPMVPTSEKKVKEVISNMETDKTQAFKNILAMYQTKARH